MTKIEEQIADVAKKIEQHRNRLKDLKAEATKQERKDDARKKLLYGAAYLSGLNTLSIDAQKRSLERVEAQITRPKDRDFLGLPLLESNKTTTEKASALTSETPSLPFGNS